MGVFIIVSGRTKSETQQLLQLKMKELFPETREYAGCQGVTMHVEQDDPQNFVLVEHWESKDHYEKYLGFRQETGVLDELVAMLEGPPTIRYFDQVDA